MNLKRVGILLAKEVRHGAKGFLFIFAVLMPLLFTLVFSLLFGTLLSNKPKLGIADVSGSRLVGLASKLDSVTVRTYGTQDQLRDAVARGSVDMGVAIPEGFDAQVASGGSAELQTYLWGQSLLKHRTVLASTLASLVRAVAGQEVPIEVTTATVGDAASVPWEQRIMPVMVLMAVIFGGVLVPASSLVHEKQKRTLGALTTTPVSLGEVLAAKGLLGALLSVSNGVLILLLNRAFGVHPGLLVLVLALGAALASTFGVLMGVIAKSLDALFAINKAIGILYYAPAIVWLFPGIPEWIGRIFPTYYMVGPVVAISQRGAGLGDVVGDLLALSGLIIGLVCITGLVARRAVRREAL